MYTTRPRVFLLTGLPALACVNIPTSNTPPFPLPCVIAPFVYVAYSTQGRVLQTRVRRELPARRSGWSAQMPAPIARLASTAPTGAPPTPPWSAPKASTVPEETPTPPSTYTNPPER